jgi:hypothetical protein
MVAASVGSDARARDRVSGALGADHLLGTRAMREWYAGALKETLRDQPHDDEVSRIGRVLEDLRAK